MTNCQTSKKTQQKTKYINIAHRKYLQNKIPTIKIGKPGIPQRVKSETTEHAARGIQTDQPPIKRISYIHHVRTLI